MVRFKKQVNLEPVATVAMRECVTMRDWAGYIYIYIYVFFKNIYIYIYLQYIHRYVLTKPSTNDSTADPPCPSKSLKVSSMKTQRCTGLSLLPQVSHSHSHPSYYIVTQGHHSLSLEVITQSHSRSLKVSQHYGPLHVLKFKKHGTCMCGCVSVSEHRMPQTLLVSHHFSSLIKLITCGGIH